MFALRQLRLGIAGAGLLRMQRQCSSVHHASSSPAASPPVPERRQSRRRYTADNTRGRASRARELVDVMKHKDTAEAKMFFDGLHPRDKLDVVRLLHLKRTKRRRNHWSSGLPRYRSKIFERRYFFREEDVTEQSTLGRGPGGQATNRRMQTVILTHTPTGLIVKFSRFPSLWLNRRAARELLNLRLEERLLGAESELGRAKALRERQSQHNVVRRERLAVRGNVIAARRTQQRNFHAVLVGDVPLPPLAVAQLGLVQRTRPLFTADLFDDECQSWWPLLHHAFQQCAASPSSCEAEAVPLLLQLLFPVAAADTSQASCREQAEAERCRGDERAIANVRRAFCCFCELYGLRLADVAKADGTARLVLARDGLNWRELQGRMVDGETGVLLPAARAAWRHVHAGLLSMHLTLEARSVRQFFAREARRETEKVKKENGQDASPPQSWAAEACAALKQ